MRRAPRVHPSTHSVQYRPSTSQWRGEVLRALRSSAAPCLATLKYLYLLNNSGNAQRVKEACASRRIKCNWKLIFTKLLKATPWRNSWNTNWGDNGYLLQDQAWRRPVRHGDHGPALRRSRCVRTRQKSKRRALGCVTPRLRSTTLRSYLHATYFPNEERSLRGNQRGKGARRGVHARRVAGPRGHHAAYRERGGSA